MKTNNWWMRLLETLDAFEPFWIQHRPMHRGFVLDVAGWRIETDAASGVIECLT